MGVGRCSVPRLLSTELITEEVLLAKLESRCCRQIPPHTVRTTSQLRIVNTQNFITLSPNQTTKCQPHSGVSGLVHPELHFFYPVSAHRYVSGGSGDVF